MQLSGKVAVVTGSAGGIGGAVATAFAGAGAEVIGLDRDEADLTQPEQIESLLAAQVRVDVHINRARISRIRTHVKQVESALAAGNKDEAKAAIARVQPELARGVARGVLHKNTAARKLSRLTRRLTTLA